MKRFDPKVNITNFRNINAVPQHTNSDENNCLSIPNEQIETEKSFSMTVSDSFFITGKGMVAVGYIDSGSIEVGESVNINGKAYRVFGIEMFRKQLNKAKAGMTVGLVLPEAKEKVPSQTIVSK